MVKMNRVIKFRAWEIENRKMVPWEVLKQYSCEIVFINAPFEIIQEQYTGEKANGNIEIYEGDTCGVYSDEPGGEVPYNFKGTVVFRDGSFWVDSGSNAFPLFQEILVWEVLGNIHQNQELSK